MLGACGGESLPTATPPPTQLLNTAAPTPTDTLAPPPTATVTFPPSAAEFVQTEAANQTASAPVPTGTPLDPVAQELGALAIGRFAREEGLDPDSIRVVDIDSVTWPDATLGCGTPVPTPDNATAPPGIPGYKIRVQVRPAGAAATYHADFVRVIRCNNDE